MTRFVPPVAEAVPFESGLVKYVAAVDPNLFLVLGSEFSEIVEIRLPPTFVLSAEPGTMVHMDPRLKAEVDMGGCCQGCTRCCCAGESCFRLNFSNHDLGEPQVVALAGRLPSKVVPVDMSRHPNGLVFRSGGFLAAVGKDWKIQLNTTSCSTGCCGGMGFVLNRLTGSSWVFLAAGGTVMRKQLEAGESIIVEQRSVFAFEGTVKMSVVRVQGAAALCCGGMGLTNTKLTGPGFVLIESMSPTKLIMGLRTG